MPKTQKIIVGASARERCGVILAMGEYALA